MALVHDAGWAETWQRSWDRLEEDYVPDRELRIRALVELPHLDAGLAEVERERRTRAPAKGRVGWDAWWQKAARDPALRFATAQRREVFGSNYPTQEFSPPADWHIAAVSEAGFAEAGVVWRSSTGTVGDPRGCMPREEGSAVSEMITALIVALSRRPSWFQRQCCRRGEGGGRSE